MAREQGEVSIFGLDQCNCKEGLSGLGKMGSLGLETVFASEVLDTVQDVVGTDVGVLAADFDTFVFSALVLQDSICPRFDAV